MRQSDPVTVALTGQLFFILVVSAILALMASYLLLRLYRRAVIKSMRRVGGSEILQPKGYLPPEPTHQPHEAPLNFNWIVRAAATPVPRPACFIGARFGAAASRLSST